MEITPGGLDDPRVVELLQRHVARARAETAPGSAHALDLAALKAPDIRFWTAWLDGEPVGCGALKQLSPEQGELKSMYTAEAARRHGVASAVLARIVEAAEHAGLARLSLETGSWPYFEPARAFYGRHGFVAGAPFGDYREDPNSVFMHRVLRRWHVRDETPADAPAIAKVTIAAFATLATLAISRKTEQYVIEALREAGALAVSLVADLDGRVIGHVAISPVTISDGSPHWYGLGPVSVAPEHQRQGVGAALIREALARLRVQGAAGCCLVGHPGYYERFGFRNVSGLVHPGVPPEVFFTLPFGTHVPQGSVAFHPGFGAEG